MDILVITFIFIILTNKYGKPDIIHSHFIGNGYIVVKSLKSKNIPLIHTEHLSTMNQDELPKYLVEIGKKTYHELDKILTVSSYLSISIRKKFNVDSTVVPNIVDASSFSYNINRK